MQTLCWLVFLSDLYPLWVSWRANRHTTLRQSIFWTILAWAAWTCTTFPTFPWPMAGIGSYLALGLTSCAMVAVLGARRPGVVAWNFVLLGLLAVVLLPVGESLASGRSLHLGFPRTLFLASTLAMGVLNYLPTRLAPAALQLALGCAGPILVLAGPETESPALEGYLPLSWFLVALTPWVAWSQWRWRPAPASEFDRLWLDFRDRFGLVWSQRLREQFNRSAAHAGWPVVLRWQGLRLTGLRPGPEEETAMVEVLRALLKRFGTEEDAELSGR